MGVGKEAATVFVDTSIEIGRQVHAPEIQESIRLRLNQFSEIVTGLQVRNEFKRRLLGEAAYLLGQLDSKKSFQKVKRHLSHLQLNRKKNICLDSLETIFEKRLEDQTSGKIDIDADLTERAKLFLRDLLRFGMATFDARMHKIFSDSGCACALQPVKEKKAFVSYDFGIKKCAKAGAQCKIMEFLSSNADILKKIANHLATLPIEEKTEELVSSEQFIREFFDHPANVQSKNPCDSVGDLIIALESQTTRNFYTMNVKESRHLCQVLKQRLIYRHPNPVHQEQEFPGANSDEIAG